MRRFTQGTTIALSFTHPQFPKANWSAELVLKGVNSSSTFPASPDINEEKFLVKIAAADSAEFEVGTYTAAYRYQNSAGDVQIVPGVEIAILPDPTKAGDHRSLFEKDLEAVENAIRQKIVGGAVDEYEVHTTVGQRRVKNMSLEELRLHRRWLVRQVNAERRAAGKKPYGNDKWRPIRSCLGNQAPIRRRRY